MTNFHKSYITASLKKNAKDHLFKYILKMNYSMQNVLSKMLLKIALGLEYKDLRLAKQ